MNMWMEAIGNLQRHRGPPIDMDMETGEISPVKLYECKACKQELPGTEYYDRHDKRTGTWRRLTTCKACSNAYNRNRRATHSIAVPSARVLILRALVKPMSVRSLCEAVGKTRRPVGTALDLLLSDGLVRHAGFGSLGTNSRIPLYVKS